MIKVYAANGLMRSAAWAAAWSDMERVDVEILPWISDDMRRKLDERNAQEDAAKQDLVEDEESRIRRIVDEHIQVALDHRLATLVTMQQESSPPTSEPCQHTVPKSMRLEPPDIIPQNDPILSIERHELPQIYHTSQIPVSTLLKNYIYLLAQDRRNLVVFGLSIAVTFLVTVFSSRINRPILEPDARSLTKDMLMASTLPTWTIISSPSMSSSQQIDTATIETPPLEATMPIDDTDVGSASYHSNLSGDLVESGADPNEDISCPWTQLISSSNVLHLGLDEVVRRNHDMCPVGK